MTRYAKSCWRNSSDVTSLQQLYAPTSALSSGSRVISTNRPINSARTTSEQYQAHLLHERKLKAETVVGQVAALRFFFVRTLEAPLSAGSPYRTRSTPHQRIPKVISPEEVAQLIDAASNLQARAILMLLYSTGIRRSELVRLRVEDIDSKRMVIHIRQGKGGKDRDVPLCPKLLETLREYWRWRKPKTWLFARGTPTRPR